jgi:hypothetical protein
MTGVSVLKIAAWIQAGSALGCGVKIDVRRVIVPGEAEGI